MAAPEQTWHISVKEFSSGTENPYRGFKSGNQGRAGCAGGENRIYKPKESVPEIVTSWPGIMPEDLPGGWVGRRKLSHF